jgi:hypothetical protein
MHLFVIPKQIKFDLSATVSALPYDSRRAANGNQPGTTHLDIHLILNTISALLKHAR